VPWVWKDSMVLSPQAWPLARSISVQSTGCQSGARTSRALGHANSVGYLVCGIAAVIAALLVILALGGGTHDSGISAASLAEDE
jgi:hypothetical protein